MNIYMLKREMLRKQKGRCAYCGKQITNNVPCDLAHLIPQRQWCKKKWGEDIIHHHLNMKVTCHNDICNSGIQLNVNKTKLIDEHVEAIKQEILEQVHDRR